jgi:hypothetical protein
MCIIGHSLKNIILWIILNSGSIYTFYLKKVYIARRMINNNKIAIDYKLVMLDHYVYQEDFELALPIIHKLPSINSLLRS